MGLFSWILLGLVAGFFAKKLHKGPDPGGWFVTMLVGIAGACVGGWLGDFTGIGEVTGFNPRSIAIATMGAILCLWAYGRLGRK
jgi:uncharacterized membrane protein YeaQ/YmgE (transglycosylase-associated protein family)